MFTQMSKEKYFLPLQDERVCANNMFICHITEWEVRTELDQWHPLWQDNPEFVRKAQEIHEAIFKERLGLSLEVEDWFMTTYDVSWVTWYKHNPYPEPATWDDQ